jgi:hypothetical protein
MAIYTRSSFLYGHLIDQTNFSLDFDEGGPELQASLNPGDYTLGTFIAEVERVLNDIGALDYTVTANRVTGLITISATGTFSLLPSSGTRIGVGVWDLLGFTGADQTGGTSYTGDSRSGTLYRPQFLLQDYVPLENLQGAQTASVNETADGEFEVLSFGTKRNMRCNISYINDYPQRKGAPIENNQNAVSEARNFLLYLVGKNKVEFYPDRDNPNLFQNLLLERTSRDGNGISFELREFLSRNLPGYYETGLLVFREIVL